MMSQVLNHLWQSTLLALALALLVLAFRKAPAGVRHGLWFAASAQFLVPFAALAALGRLLAPAIRLPQPPAPEAAFIAQAAQPFSQPALSPDPLATFPFAHGPELQATLGQAPAAAPVAHADAAAAAIHSPPQLDVGLLLLAVWAFGSAVMLVVWARRWARLRRVVRSARRLDWRGPMPVLAAPSLVEPGLVGLWRPVLLVPETLPEALSRPEIDALIEHEACHLRRRDNLTATLHMLVEALFWFHPLTWWIGARLIEERERACDEAVVKAGHDRAAYARSLVEICRLFLQSPLDCVAGASGSNLKTRVEAIMTAPPTSPLSRSRKALLLAAGVCAVATPVTAGLLTTPEGQKAVARARVVAARLAPAVLTPGAPSTDETAPANPVVLAQNTRLLAPAESVARLDTPVGAVARDLPALTVAQAQTQAPAPQAEAAPAAPALPADPKAQAANFVDFYASTGQHVLARWRDPVCVKVMGLPDEQAAVIKARIESVAKSVGARTQLVCRTPNVQIGFSADPQAMLDGISAKTPEALGDWGGTRGQTTVTLPVQAWYATNGGAIAENTATDANGLKVRVLYQGLPPAGAPPGYPSGAAFNPSPGTGVGNGWTPSAPVGGAYIPRSRQPSELHRQFSNALVIVDTRRTEGKSLGLVSDYVAVLALAQPTGLGGCNVLPSVTDLFANCSGRAAPEGLTPADAAFLTSLYAAKTGKKGDEHADIASHMASILAGSAGARAEAQARPVAVASAAPVRSSPATPPNQAANFVDFYASTDQHVLARWRDPVCVKTFGLTADQAAAVEGRIEQVAKSVGARAGPQGCKNPNVEIQFTDDPQGKLDGIVARTPRALGDWSGSRVHKTITLPIQAWYLTNGGTVAENSPSAADGLKVRVRYQAMATPCNCDLSGAGAVLGAGPQANGSYVPPGSTWSSNPWSQNSPGSGWGSAPGPNGGLGGPPRDLHRNFANALVIVDTRHTEGKSLGQVSDYVALLVLAQPERLGGCNVLPSVTDLFASCPGRTAPDGLTPADAAFLTALYAAKTGKKGDEQADIATHMASILGASASARAEAAAERPIRPASAEKISSPPRLAVTPVANTTGGNPQVSDFIQSYGEAFWNTDNRICVKVDGLTPEKNASFKARVEADARAVGVSIGRSECGLRNQIEIRFAADAERAVTDVLNYYHHPVWPFPLDRPQGADRPIKAYYGMVYDFAGGAGGSGLGRHPNARQKLNLAIVVVDPARTSNMSPDAVADYVAMLAISQPRSLDKCNVLPSITDMFANGCSGRSAAAALTAADTAYLTALYTGSSGIRATRSPEELVDGMARRLAGGGRGTTL
jgi:beta-lactamase regulating signal transducer with metallopeptidase domain